MEEKQVKIVFELEQDEDGWPPAGAESVWAVDLGQDLYRISNIPFFVPLLSMEDIIIAKKEEDNILYYQKTYKHSDHSTLRIMCKDTEQRINFITTIKNEGCEVESIKEYPSLLTIDVPPSSNYTKILKIIKKEVDDYEESCISEHHRNQK